MPALDPFGSLGRTPFVLDRRGFAAGEGAQGAGGSGVMSFVFDLLALAMLAWGLKREGLSWTRSISWTAGFWAARAALAGLLFPGQVMPRLADGAMCITLFGVGLFLCLAACFRPLRRFLRPASTTLLLMIGLWGIESSFRAGAFGEPELYRLPMAVLSALIGIAAHAAGRRIRPWAALSLLSFAALLMALSGAFQGLGPVLEGFAEGHFSLGWTLALIVQSGLLAGALRFAVAPEDRSPWRWCPSCRRACGPGKCPQCGRNPRWSARERFEAWSTGTLLWPALVAVFLGMAAFRQFQGEAGYLAFGQLMNDLVQSAAIVISSLLSVFLARGVHRDRIAEIEASYGEPPLAPENKVEPADPISIAHEAPAASLPTDELRQRAGSASG
jgi:hypothetical protein